MSILHELVRRAVRRVRNASLGQKGLGPTEGRCARRPAAGIDCADTRPSADRGPPPGTGSTAPAGRPAAQAPAASPSTLHRDAVSSPTPDPRSGGGEFRAALFSHDAGQRAYRLFVPHAAAAPGARPLLVMLHGCKQDAADFAAGTRMNELAQAHGWVVLYPEQARSANGLGCWNWFKAGHQQRGRGEPAILAGLVRHVLATERIDARRVYVAGLSAGGAMAATLAGTYPELFAAVGIHSGLPYAAAHDVMSAFRAMRAGPRAAPAARPAATAGPPTIVFHGDLDDTVHPDNGEALVAGARADTASLHAPSTRSWTHVERGRAPGGHAYTRTVHTATDGRIQAEHWLVHGAGHAWFGGSPQGSYTDPRGPDASAEMLRFFAAHCRQAEVASAA